MLRSTYIFIEILFSHTFFNFSHPFLFLAIRSNKSNENKDKIKYGCESLNSMHLSFSIFKFESQRSGGFMYFGFLPQCKDSNFKTRFEFEYVSIGILEENNGLKLIFEF